MLKDKMTTENLRKKFKNNFTLCNFSIRLARNLIGSGVHNPLREVLEAVAKHHEADMPPEEEPTNLS